MFLYIDFDLVGEGEPLSNIIKHHENRTKTEYYNSAVYWNMTRTAYNMHVIFSYLVESLHDRGIERSQHIVEHFGEHLGPAGRKSCVGGWKEERMS